MHINYFFPKITHRQYERNEIRMNLQKRITQNVASTACRYFIIRVIIHQEKAYRYLNYKFSNTFDQF
jgi:hypothetical protein